MNCHTYTNKCDNNQHKCYTCIHEDIGRFENPCRACLNVSANVCYYEKAKED